MLGRMRQNNNFETDAWDEKGMHATETARGFQSPNDVISQDPRQEPNRHSSNSKDPWKLSVLVGRDNTSGRNCLFQSTSTNDLLLADIKGRLDCSLLVDINGRRPSNGPTISVGGCLLCISQTTSANIHACEGDIVLPGLRKVTVHLCRVTVTA